MTTYILGAGVAHDWLEKAAAEGYDVGRNTKEFIAASAAKMKEDRKTIPNTILETVFLYPDDPANFEKFETMLKSRKWDAITFGGGVRTIPELGDYFTRLIHTATREQPQATLLFPLLPEDVVPSIKKYLPNAN